MNQKLKAAWTVFRDFVKRYPVLVFVTQPEVIGMLCLCIVMRYDNSTLRQEINSIETAFDTDHIAVNEDIRTVRHAIDRIESRQYKEELRLDDVQASYKTLKDTTTLTQPRPTNTAGAVASGSVNAADNVGVARSTVPVVTVSSPSRSWYYLWLR